MRKGETGNKKGRVLSGEIRMIRKDVPEAM
jgi:hypothetical protein